MAKVAEEKKLITPKELLETPEKKLITPKELLEILKKDQTAFDHILPTPKLSDVEEGTNSPVFPWQEFLQNYLGILDRNKIDTRDVNGVEFPYSIPPESLISHGGRVLSKFKTLEEFQKFLTELFPGSERQAEIQKIKNGKTLGTFLKKQGFQNRLFSSHRIDKEGKESTVKPWNIFAHLGNLARIFFDSIGFGFLNFGNTPLYQFGLNLGIDHTKTPPTAVKPTGREGHMLMGVKFNRHDGSVCTLNGIETSAPGKEDLSGKEHGFSGSAETSITGTKLKFPKNSEEVEKKFYVEVGKYNIGNFLPGKYNGITLKYAASPNDLNDKKTPLIDHLEKIIEEKQGVLKNIEALLKIAEQNNNKKINQKTEDEKKDVKEEKKENKVDKKSDIKESGIKENNKPINPLTPEEMQKNHFF